MTDLQSLISRLEKAEGPDWKLSQDIGEAIGAQPRYEHPASQEPTHLNYTASLDAAVGLVPEGWLWVVGTDPDPGKMYFATLRGPLDQKRPEGQFEAGFSNSPAIALCIAALKARASEES